MVNQRIAQFEILIDGQPDDPGKRQFVLFELIGCVRQPLFSRLMLHLRPDRVNLGRHFILDPIGRLSVELPRRSELRFCGLEAAAPIFNKRGYEGSSLNDLMEATGLKKGGIYRHFSSKEELAAEAFDYTWDAAWNTRLLHLDEKANGIEKLKQLIANFIDRRPPVAGGCPILNTAVDADDGNPVLRAHVARALRSWLGRLQDIVEQAQKRGEARRGIDPKAVATFIVASLEGALMISRLQRNDEALRRIQSQLERYLENEVVAL